MKFPIGTGVSCSIGYVMEGYKHLPPIIGTVIGYDTNHERELCYHVKTSEKNVTYWHGFVRKLTKLEKALK